jgi:hypothetical protein
LIPFLAISISRESAAYSRGVLISPSRPSHFLMRLVVALELLVFQQPLALRLDRLAGRLHLVADGVEPSRQRVGLAPQFVEREVQLLQCFELPQVVDRHVPS